MVIVQENKVTIGLSGFWINTKLWCGKYLELDNVIVSQKHRSKGVGNLISTFLEQNAKENNCLIMALDAYTNNFTAHKFYYNQGFVPKGFHFIKSI
jgi:GNAT superfamily N-acetyltransferase